MKPTNEELVEKYTSKMNLAKEKIKEIQIILESVVEDDLRSELLRRGCKERMWNYSQHILHCKNQIKKFSIN